MVDVKVNTIMLINPYFYVNEINFEGGRIHNEIDCKTSKEISDDGYISFCYF